MLDRTRAACAGINPEVFYPGRGGDTNTPKTICNTCPIRTECLNEALTNGEIFGVWGGATEAERKRMRARQRDRHDVGFLALCEMCGRPFLAPSFAFRYDRDECRQRARAVTAARRRRSRIAS